MATDKLNDLRKVIALCPIPSQLKTRSMSCTRAMKNWSTGFHESRPMLNCHCETVFCILVGAVAER